MIRVTLLPLAVALVLMCAANGFAAGSGSPHYLVTNDDTVPYTLSGVSVFTIGTGGSLTFQQQVQTGGYGISGGYFPANRVVVLNSGSAQCVYASDAFFGDIAGISIGTLQVGGSAFGSVTDTGASNGIGLAVNAQYLYASFTDSSTIGTFQVQPGCSLTFVNDVSAIGLHNGIINGMAVHGNILVATYTDGSIESFDISAGTPISHGDKQFSTAFLSSQGASYAGGIDITQDSHFAVFGDTATSTTVEVSDISSGKLAKTVVYTLGSVPNSSNIMLSPDETLLYISNTQGDKVSAAFFNPSTGKLSVGCSSGSLRNYVSSFSYLASLGLGSTTGTGGVLYIAEFGTISAIAIVNVSSTSGKCTLTEATKSPVANAFSTGLLSIGTFPPRVF